MPERHVGQVDADQGRGMAAREVLGDGAAPIAAMRAESLIAEFLGHQFVPQVAKSEQAAMAFARLGVAVARQAGNHDIERVGGIAAMRGRIGQQRDQLVEPEERVRVAVGQRPAFRLFCLVLRKLWLV